MQFTEWAVASLRPYTILAWTAQSVNCHIALKAMYYLLIVGTLADVIVDLVRIVNYYILAFILYYSMFILRSRGPSL